MTAKTPRAGAFGSFPVFDASPIIAMESFYISLIIGFGVVNYTSFNIVEHGL